MEQYFQKEIETAPVEQIKAWQIERLIKTVHHVYDNVPRPHGQSRCKTG